MPDLVVRDALTPFDCSPETLNASGPTIVTLSSPHRLRVVTTLPDTALTVWSEEKQDCRQPWHPYLHPYVAVLRPCKWIANGQDE